MQWLEMLIDGFGPSVLKCKLETQIEDLTKMETALKLHIN